MKKIFATFFLLILILSLCCVPAFAEPSAENAVKTPKDQLNYFDTTPAAGNKEKGFDVEKFSQTQMSQDMMSALHNYFTYPAADQANEAIANYWAIKGVTKVYYDLDDPERQWAAYIPNGIYFDGGDDYKYPVVFVMHGGNNTILMTESYGWSELCGKEGFITVIPWAQSYDNGSIMLQEIPRIMDTLRQDYAIDESRVYAVGFSAGGRTCINSLMEYPDFFAAGAIQPTSLFPSGEEAEYQNDYGFKTVFTHEDFERITSYTMPLMMYGGTYESCWPVSLDYDLARKVSSEDLTRYLSITGAVFPEITDEGRKTIASQAGNIASRLTGFDFDPKDTRIVERQGTYCVLGGYNNADGVCTFCCLAVEGMPHWPLYCQAELIWDFMSQFARDMETGELLYAEGS